MSELMYLVLMYLLSIIVGISNVRLVLIQIKLLHTKRPYVDIKCMRLSIVLIGLIMGIISISKREILGASQIPNFIFGVVLMLRSLLEVLAKARLCKQNLICDDGSTYKHEEIEINYTSNEVRIVINRVIKYRISSNNKDYIETCKFLKKYF